MKECLIAMLEREWGCEGVEERAEPAVVVRAGRWKIGRGVRR